MKKLLVVALLALVGCGAEETFAPRDEAVQADVETMAAKLGPEPVAVLKVKGRCRSSTDVCLFDASRSTISENATQFVEYRWIFDNRGGRPDRTIDTVYTAVPEVTRFFRTGYTWIFLKVTDDASLSAEDKDYILICDNQGPGCF